MFCIARSISKLCAIWMNLAKLLVEAPVTFLDPDSCLPLLSLLMKRLGEKIGGVE
jgi:hypothetical protein